MENKHKYGGLVPGPAFTPGETIITPMKRNELLILIEKIRKKDRENGFLYRADGADLIWNIDEKSESGDQ